jgi:nascent polypeptide-associated complex subunit alpha
MPRKMGSREANRMMARMGMQLKEMDDITKVVFEGANRRITIENPEVASVTVQGQTMYQVGGGKVKEETVSGPTLPTQPSPEDVTLVAQQAKVPQKEAENALRQTNGDLAQAILLLQKKKP